MRAAEGAAGSDVVTRVGGNGVDFGFQTAAEPGRWQTVAATPPRGPVPDQYQGLPILCAIGDSAVVDTFGLGGAALRHAPETLNGLGRFAPEGVLDRPGVLMEAEHPRLPIRTGMCSDTRRVLFPNSSGGIPPEEITVAEALHELGYATACFGKWHLGHLPQHLPTEHGFDEYLGLPYSNDMDRVPGVGPRGRAAFDDPHIEYWNVPLLHNTEVVERPADQTTLTRRYTEAAVEFIRGHRDRPALSRWR